jgi:hypothetical protein
MESFPNCAINQLVILTQQGLNQGGNDVIAVTRIQIIDTLNTVYEQLHILVENEIEDKREACRIRWNTVREQAWERYKEKWFVPEDFGWIQYVGSQESQAILTKFEAESFEILDQSDKLWEKKEMLWLSSLDPSTVLQLEHEFQLHSDL